MDNPINVFGKVFVAFSILFSLIFLPQLDMGNTVINNFYMNGVMVAALGLFFVAVIKAIPE